MLNISVDGKRWSETGICGYIHPLPDGGPTECDPDGEKPCRSHHADGVCGNTTEHCSCIDCIDYNYKYNKWWRESGGKQMWRNDGRCGSHYILPNGRQAECDPDGQNPCCGDLEDGKCDNMTDCSCDDCVDYKRIYKDWRETGGKQKWRYDGRCGDNHPQPDGKAAECDPDSERPCCSSWWDGVCGNTTEHCSCIDCIDYNFNKWWRESGKKQMWRNDGRCGSDYKLPNETQAQCDPYGENPCCNNWEGGMCGNTTEHCSCDDCVDYKRMYKDWRETGGKQKWRYDGRCGDKHPLPDGQAAECDPDSERPCCSSSWDEECGNTAEYCSCDDCVDYSILYRDWRKSDGKQRWRYDGRCGRNHLLLDNTPAGCNPDGESPCCSSSWDGECGNTAEYCSCDDCVDYRMIYKDWREMEGKQKWRYDGRCGTKFPLPDGTPSQCDPESEKPCCDKDGYCSDRTFSCLCEGCIDYRLVQKLTRSGANCTVARLFSGFLKYVCYDEQREEFTYKCTASDMYYKYDSDYMFSNKCENDPYSYQSCGFGTPITNADVLCGGYICGKREENREDEYVYNYFVCSGDECKYEKREECTVSNDTYKSLFCDGKCDSPRDCFDEGDCNGYTYGISCNMYGEQHHLPAALVCNPDELLCDDGADKHDCDKNTGHTCTHYFGKKASNTTTLVPLLNYTRCSVFKVEGFMEEDIPPYCLDYLDQTNCSDIERVGGYCEVGGFLASVSKFVVCYKFDQWFKVPVKICDDNLQNDCQSDLSTGCTIHKHRLCDGEKDCPDGNDEVHDICEKMEEGKLDFKCVRRFNLKHGNISFPSSWIMDGTVDCMEGEDEGPKKWAACKGEHRKVVLQGQKCQDAFRCLGDRDFYVPFDQLCDGVESCKDGGENEVCRTARDFPSLLTNVSYKNDTIRDVCLNHGANCEIKEFSGLWGETDVFGVTTKNQFWVPSSRTNCSQLFGENYLYLSCMDLCSETDVKCPL